MSFAIFRPSDRWIKRFLFGDQLVNVFKISPWSNNKFWDWGGWGKLKNCVIFSFYQLANFAFFYFDWPKSGVFLQLISKIMIFFSPADFAFCPPFQWSTDKSQIYFHWLNKNFTNSISHKPINKFRDILE